MANISMRPVKIDDAARARAKEIKTYAFEHRESLTDLRNRLAARMPLKDPENYSMQVPVGYNVAYTVEQRDRGWLQCISVYQNTPRMAPEPNAVATIITELFGIEPAKNPVPGKGSGVLAEALEVSPQDLPNGCIAMNLAYRFTFPESTAPA